MPLRPGTRIGAYDVIELVGAGGMGEVYRARDTNLHRNVALKILPDIFATDPDRLPRFRREAQLLASLNHQNIGHIYGFEDGGGNAALVLEFVEGPTLADRLAQGPIPLEEAIPIARQIAEALEAAHAQGVVHRDLKPANIKVTPNGMVKVLDFGLAKALDPAGAPSADSMNSPTLTARATRLGVIIGTAAYMSPEQARGKATDRRADVWAFGAVLYEILVGRRAFNGETITDTIAAVVRQEPDWTCLPPATPAPVRRLLRRCLEKDVHRRLHDMADARIEIVDAIEGKPENAGPPAPDASRSAHRWPLAWAVVATAASIALAVMLSLRGPSEKRLVTRVDIDTPHASDPSSFALSPDGRQLVFSADEVGGTSQLWLLAFDQRPPRALPGTEEATDPFWSPDGRAIGFFAGGRLKRLDFATGVIRVLASSPAPRGGVWAHGDTIVFSANTTGSLSKVSAAGGPVSDVTHLMRGQYSHRWPRLLPDGKRILYSAFLGQASNRGLFMIPVSGGEPRRILNADELGDAAPVYAPPGALLIVRQGVLLARPFDPDREVTPSEPTPLAVNVGSDSAMFRLAVSVSSTGSVLAHRPSGFERRQLEWVDRSGNVTGRVSSPDDNGMAYPSLSPDQRHVVVNRMLDVNPHIWMMDVAQGTFTRITSGTANELAPLWSPDGSQIAFRTSRNGSYDLYLKTMSGGAAGAEEALVVDERTKTPLDWSPDGRQLLFGSLDPQNGADLYAIDVKGDRKPYPVLRTTADEMDAHLSPDGRLMVYRSNESGRFEIYVRPFVREGGSQVVQLISTTGGSEPRWSPNGKEVYFISPDAKMMAASVALAPDGSVTSGTPAALFPVHLASGAYITTAGTASRAQYDVARDGRFLINVSTQDYVTPPISLVLNWDTLLPRR